MNKLFLFLAVSVAGASIPSSLAWALSPYNQNLDIDKLEQTMALLGSRVPIEDTQWLKLLGDKKEQEYTISSGDNLWMISKRKLGDPFLWRKLWQVNPELTNPHVLNKGQMIRYYNEMAARNLASVQEVIKIPVIKLVPQGKDSYADLDKDTVVNVDLKNRFRPSFLVLSPGETYLGEIKGSYTERDNMHFHESLYVESTDGQLKVGETYTIIHEERDLMDQTQNGAPEIGKLVRLVGELKLMEQGEKLIRAEIKGRYGPVERGDKIIAHQKAVSWSVFVDPPNELQARIVVGEDPELKMFGQGQLVLLNKGTQDGMKEGYVFRVWREKDLKTDETAGVEPETKGEVRVIHCSTTASVGYILRNVEPLLVGDTVIPRQAFTNPLPPPLKKHPTLEIP